MANNFAFQPSGATVVVGTQPKQVVSSNNIGTTAYRVSNLLGTRQYLGWAPATTIGSVPQNINTTAPIVGNPGANVMGLLGNSVETFNLPAGCWFAASSENAFEITPGEGV